jgi:hypothetical protein
MSGALKEGATAEEFFSGQDSHRDGQWLAEVRAGGCPGREIIGAYFKHTLSLAAIQVALKEYHASGALARWQVECVDARQHLDLRASSRRGSVR